MNVKNQESQIPAEIRQQLTDAINAGKNDLLIELLDDSVHTAAERAASETFEGDFDSDEYDDHIDSASQEASDINNNGLFSQAEFLYKHGFGEAVVMALKEE